MYVLFKFVKGIRKHWLPFLDIKNTTGFLKHPFTTFVFLLLDISYWVLLKKNKTTTATTTKNITENSRNILRNTDFTLKDNNFST